MEMRNIITWLHACYESGYFTQREAGLDLSEIGSYKFFKRLVNMIAKREGFGDLLAEGLLRTGQRFGKEAVAQFPDDMSDVGLGNDYCPRQYITTAFLYAFKPRQPIDMLHEVSYMIAG